MVDWGGVGTGACGMHGYAWLHVRMAHVRMAMHGYMCTWHGYACMAMHGYMCAQSSSTLVRAEALPCCQADSSLAMCCLCRVHRSAARTLRRVPVYMHTLSLVVPG